MKQGPSYSKILAVLIPIFTIAYAAGEYYGWIDKITHRDKAIEGLNRLSTVYGYPESFIYDDEKDRYEFNALEERISKKSDLVKLKNMLVNSNKKPTLIVTIGKPITIEGLTFPDLKQEEINFYPENQPIFYMFGPVRYNASVNQSSKVVTGGKACTIGDLRRWIDEEKDYRRFIFGVVSINMLAIATILLRKEPSTKKKK